MASDNDQKSNALVLHQLDTHKGVFLGENHDEFTTKQFLIDHMADMKAHGVTTLYLELPQALVTAMSHGYDCAEIYASGSKSIAAVPADIRPMRAGMQSFLSVIEAAQRHGIRVLGDDAAAVHKQMTDAQMDQLFSNEELNRRDTEALNFVRQTSDGGKFVMLGGFHHARGKNASVEAPSAGIAKRLGIPSIGIMSTGAFLNELDHFRPGRNHYTQLDGDEKTMIVKPEGHGAADYVIVIDTPVALPPLHQKAGTIGADLARSNVCVYPYQNPSLTHEDMMQAIATIKKSPASRTPS